MQFSPYVASPTRSSVGKRDLGLPVIHSHSSYLSVSDFLTPADDNPPSEHTTRCLRHQLLSRRRMHCRRSFAAMTSGASRSRHGTDAGSSRTVPTARTAVIRDDAYLSLPPSRVSAANRWLVGAGRLSPLLDYLLIDC
jgi:hypothetical protein